MSSFFTARHTHPHQQEDEDSSFKKRKRGQDDGDDSLSGPLSFLSTSHQHNNSSPTLATSPSSLWSDHQVDAPTLQETNQESETLNKLHHQTISRFRLKSTFPLPKRRHQNPATSNRDTSPRHCEACGKRTCFICIRNCEADRCRSRHSRRCAAIGKIDEERGGQQSNHHGCNTPVAWVRQQQQQGYQRVQGRSNSTYNKADARIGSSGEDGLHQGIRVCGQCCLEVGVEGTVWCTTCYEDDEEEDYEEERGNFDEEGVTILSRRNGKARGLDKRELHVESVEKVAGWLEGCDE
ncbi:hypothetical protein MMC25_007283 [Agyrium rufum]|nr:hypothetical protein [Agyrium rufum]